MNFITVQVRGMDKVSLGATYMVKAAQSALRLAVPDAAQVIAEEAKTIVPVDTGRLRDAIHVEPSSSGSFPQCIDRDEKQQVVVSPAYASFNEYGFSPPYARRIEFGFMGTDRLGREYHQAAQPFMRPAADAKRDEAKQMIKDQLFEALAGASGFNRGRA